MYLGVRIGDYNQDPNIQALKRRGLIIHESTFRRNEA